MKKKVLAITCNPINTPRLDLDSEIQDLQEAFQRAQHRERFEFKHRIVKTYEDFRRSILDVKPNIIHFCGHGTNEGLVLADDQNYAKVAGNEVLVDLLKIYADHIECFLLNACDTEPLADALVQHLNYVVGMNQPVYDDAAKAFSQSFYDGIGAGDPYEIAFEIGRNAVLSKRFGAGRTFKVANRKLFAVEQDGEEIEIKNQEHLIPVIKVNPSPTLIKPLWLEPEVKRQAVQDLLQAIESGFNTIKLFHTDEAIVLKDQYIPVQVTLERRYKHSVETIGGYAESEAELRRIYAMKGSSEEEIQEEIKRQQVDWEEARRQHQRIVVLADPGMGKSTLLRREVVTTIQEAYKALENDKPLKEITIPLFIRLSTLAHKVMQMSMVEAILESIQEDELCYKLLRDHKDTEVMTFLNTFLKEQLLNGKGLLLLDALDEVPDGNRQKLLEKLNGFAKAHPICPIVGTSRIVGYGGRLVDGAKDMEIVPFTQKQTEEYIKIWFEKAPLKDESVSSQSLIKALRERPQLAGLAQNPLLLSLICSLYQRDQLTLPTRRSQIYEQAVNCMLGEWNQTRLDNDKDRTTAKIRLLEELAYHFTSAGQEVFDYEDLYDWMESYLEDGDAPRDLRNDKTGALIAELSEEDGILQKLYRDKNDDQYLFLHRTFQEYFTASYLKRSLKKNKKNPAYVTELIQKYCWNYDWHETLTLLAGLMDNPMVLIEAIAAEKDDIFQTQLLLAGRCLAECRELFHPLVDKIIDRIYQFWLAYPDAEFIQSVVVAIGQARTEMIKRLRASLGHIEDSRVRESAVKTLIKVSNNNSIEALMLEFNNFDIDFKRRILYQLSTIDQNDKAIKILILSLGEEDKPISNSASRILSNNSNDNVINELISALNHENSNIRWMAAQTLRSIGNNRVINKLISALDHESDQFNWRIAVILGWLGNDQGVDILISKLSDEDYKTRQIIVEALGQVINDRAIDALISALEDEDYEVRWHAVEALKRDGSDKAIHALTALNNECNTIQLDTAELLDQVSGSVFLSSSIIPEKQEQTVNETSSHLDELFSQLFEEDRDIEESMAESSEVFNNTKSVDILTHSIRDENKNIKINAIVELGELGIREAVDKLISALKDNDSDVRWNAAAALGKIGDDKAVDELILALKDSDNGVRVRAAESLGQISSDDKVIDALISALNDEHDTLVACAAKMLGQIGNTKAIDALISGFNNSIGYAAVALAQTGNAKAIDALISALNHESDDFRWLAASELRLVTASNWRQISNEEAVDALISSLRDRYSEIRRFSAEVLGQIRHEKAVGALVIALNDEEFSVCEKALEALKQIGSDVCLERLLQSEDSNLIYRSSIFSLARIWAVRFSRKGLPFIPVYPEWVKPAKAPD